MLGLGVSRGESVQVAPEVAWSYDESGRSSWTATGGRFRNSDGDFTVPLRTVPPILHEERQNSGSCPVTLFLDCAGHLDAFFGNSFVK